MKKRRRVSSKTIMTSKTNKTDNSKSKKDFLWWALRVSFWGMIVSFLFLPYDLILKGYSFFSIILLSFFLLSVPSSPIFSIINLVKKRDKKFSVMALVVSVILLIVIIVVLIWVI